MSLASLADERQTRAQDMLYQQVSLMALVNSESKFEQYRSLLSQHSLSPSELKPIEHEIAQFWLSRQIPIRNSSTNHLGDPFIRAMALEPELNGYLQIQNRIRHLHWLAQQGWWQPIIIDELIRPSKKHPSIPTIAKRLWLLGDAERSATTSTLLDEKLSSALKRFQRRHGLQPDAIIGPETMKWLNVQPIERARMLANNFVLKAEFMAQRGDQFLVINIPAFEMALFSKGRVELESRVIVGKPYRPTPLLSGAISNVVINPSWRVPKKILYNDLLPHVRKDGNYIAEGNFDVFDRSNNLVVRTAQQWSDLARGPFPYRFVQRPGYNNTLGRYKFYFPNDFSIFLHDTSNPKLFERSNRALSSGCIRVENVEGLANWMAANLVKDKQTWVDRHAERTRTQWFALNSTLNVHLVYWTAWIDEHNQAQFRNDIYQLQTLNTLEDRAGAQINDL
ncbi:L,D-transpeptidase family protein [Shewanella halifaxensis]|uniref:L,D-transpeptidase family protein n=1 Tax=Shewanella halifaxensis TaxID=271098 RepID=UPI001CBFD660|nr:L,D-transpeptidase family protein [Shewanella halifaxensis]